MKGLMIKDILCLKKQLIVFAYVVTSVFLVAVMYVLSARFGNLALVGNGMRSSEELSSVDVKNLGTVALVFFMLLPLACVGDMVHVFEAGGKANFGRLSAALPVSPVKRLLSRYLSVYAIAALGVFTDTLIAFVLSVLTDMIGFSGLLGIILSGASVMVIYSVFVIFFCLLLGIGKELYAQLLSLTAMAGIFLLANIKGIRRSLAAIATTASAPAAVTDALILWKLLDFIKEKYYILLLFAAIITLFTFAGSLALIKRKRGVI